MATYDLHADDLVVGSAERELAVREAVKAERAKRRRQRLPSLARALEQASKGGVTVTDVTVGPDGSVQLTFGEGAAGVVNNDWDGVLHHGKN